MVAWLSSPSAALAGVGGAATTIPAASAAAIIDTLIII
ncbi:MAG: hypothetical protein K0R83_2956 [Caulobacter sp.]|nr:hypothetical protein [Caulobacter sp.]